MNLIASFLEIAEGHGTRTAIVSGDGRAISFSELARSSGALAQKWQAKGLQQGDRVLLAMPVGIELYQAIAALWRLGATIVFPEPALGLPGLRHAMRITNASAVLAIGAYRMLRVIVPEFWGVRHHLTMDADGAGDRLADLAGEHAALISFTSGSTGKPKAIVRSHGFLAAQDMALDALIRPAREAETDLVAFPVFVIANLARGTTSVLPNWRLRRPDRAQASDIARLFAAHAITRALVPPSIGEVLAGGPKLGLDTIFTGGGPVFPDLLERLQTVLPASADIVSVYGSTEAEPIAWQSARAITASQWQAMKTGAGLLAGKPISAITLRLDADEILVTGDHVNKSYLGGAGDADNKLHDGQTIWHRTGDAGQLDEGGNLWLRGRYAGRCGGLYPFEAEAPARFWPGVKRAALAEAGGQALLAIEGDTAHRATWAAEAARIGVERVLPVKAIPLDRRHRSKVDYKALRQIITRSTER